VKRRASEEFLRSIIVKPAFARLEARDYRVTRGGIVFGGVLIG
jgi:hypothetical protein